MDDNTQTQTQSGLEQIAAEGEGETWGIVELMGHKVLAGKVRQSDELGFPLLRIDIPLTERGPALTVFHGAAAIYSVTFVSEAVATATARRLAYDPIAVFAPELITREKHEEVARRYEEMIEQQRDELQRFRALGAGNYKDSEPDGGGPEWDRDA